MNLSVKYLKTELLTMSLPIFSGCEVSDDGRYVLIEVRNGCDPVNKLFYVDLEKIDYKIKGKGIFLLTRNMAVHHP